MYDPVIDSFQIYKSAPIPEKNPKLNLSIDGEVELPWASSIVNGNPVPKDNISELRTPADPNYQDVLDRMAESHSEETSNNSSNTTQKYSKAPKDVMNRAVKAAKYLMDNGNFTKEQASAIVGVMIDENKVDPSSYMKAEKNGKGAKGTGGFGYGAGIGSWTFEDAKNELLKQGGYKPYTPIESLSLEEQLKLFVIDSNNRMKRYYDALRRCNNLEDASATAVLITGGVGKSKNWDTHPTQQEAKLLSDWYGRSNDARFGKSSNHWNLDKRRLDYARQVLEQL